MTHSDSQLTLEELQQWQRAIAEADRHNRCHCKQCDAAWVASTPVACPDWLVSRIFRHLPESKKRASKTCI
ncbi:MAG: hypothetical protein LH647_02035, partial [Leptolyngbyaceae cyanobacterium CAN_BIN12]|nr:hypothetical protein [Leptolyngbyaceae cyanobacterium CAN_BIN12]